MKSNYHYSNGSQPRRRQLCIGLGQAHRPHLDFRRLAIPDRSDLIGRIYRRQIPGNSGWNWVLLEEEWIIPKICLAGRLQGLQLLLVDFAFPHHTLSPFHPRTLSPSHPLLGACILPLFTGEAWTPALTSKPSESLSLESRVSRLPMLDDSETSLDSVCH